jgi:hypothetical protein
MDYLLSLRGEAGELAGSIAIMKEDEEYDMIIQNIEDEMMQKYQGL